MADVFFYVQHLLGIGHFRRSVAIANALTHRGLSVHLASGGQPVLPTGLGETRLIQLPPVRARNGDFSDLVDENEQSVDDGWWQRRQQQLIDSWMSSSAPVLLTESFPFGRRMMRQELLPLLQQARAQNFAKLNV